MRALIVTAAAPPVPGRDVHAIYRRLGMFVAAIAGVCEEIEILHFAQPDHWSLGKDPVELNEMQSSYWGRNVNAIVAPANPIDSSLPNYVRSIFSAAYQGRFSPFAGRLQVAAIEASLRRTPGLVFVHRLPAMIPMLQVAKSLPPVYFDLDDIEHWIVLRAALDKATSGRELRRLFQIPAIVFAEYSAARLARKTFVCSELDMLYLRKLGFGEGVTCVPNAIEVPQSIRPPAKEPTILFLGGYHFSPNADAADRLISRIWPRIRSKNPAARLVIAGNSPQSIRSFDSAPAGVEFPGIVPDLEQLYRETRVVCCPITRGGGTRLKLVEAAAFGKPIVSSTIGAEGLSFENETEILLRDEDDAIADACIRLLADDQLCQRLGQRAYRKVRQRYNRSEVSASISAQLLQAVGMESGN